ncbi:MAG TPA: saccharopine dehydrogenase NADP-binding domain-containing protein [Solirubrobacteraceae bacterium]
MSARIVLFGATGFTGELTARALVDGGATPLLVGRDATRVAALAQALGVESAVADATAPDGAAGLAALLRRGDVLVSTVGPFARWGEPAVLAAIAAGAHYLDSTGEPAFIRRVFEHHDRAASAAGCGLLTAMGYDYVPGNLAAALALREAGERAVRVDVGYFVDGDARGQFSGGTRASAAGMLAEPSYAFRDGRLVTERGARHLRDFGPAFAAAEARGAGDRRVHGESGGHGEHGAPGASGAGDGGERAPGEGRAARDGDAGHRDRNAISIGASEQFALARTHPGLRDVGVWLGWFGPASRPLQLLSGATALATLVPGVRRALTASARRLVPGSTGGPDAGTRAKARSNVVAVASDASGSPLATVRVSGESPYDFTAGMLAWAAMRAAGGGLIGSGALGPVDGLRLDELERGAAAAGISRAA